MTQTQGFKITVHAELCECVCVLSLCISLCLCMHSAVYSISVLSGPATLHVHVWVLGTQGLYGSSGCHVHKITPLKHTQVPVKIMSRLPVVQSRSFHFESGGGGLASEVF